MKKNKKQAPASQEYTGRAKKIESYFHRFSIDDRELRTSWIARPKKDDDFKKDIAMEIKRKANELNRLIVMAQGMGLTVEVRESSTVMAAGTPPLQVAIFEHLEY